MKLRESPQNELIIGHKDSLSERLDKNDSNTSNDDDHDGH